MTTKALEKLGNIEQFEARVAEAVANNEFATVDIRKCRNVFAEEPFRLDDEFLKQYEGKEPEWGPLGWFTFKRTYARRIEREDGTSVRTEEWTETVRRVVEGNLNLIKNDPVVTQEYGQKLFDLIWNLVFTPPGRGLWISGTEFAKRTGDAFNNCWAIVMKPHHYGVTNKIFTRWNINPHKKYVSYPFAFIFDQLMKGGGVGFLAEKSVVAEIPEVKQKVNLIFEVSKDNPDFDRIMRNAKWRSTEWKSVKWEGYEHLIKVKHPFRKDFYRYRPPLRLTIADSREGWCEALAALIDLHFEKASDEPITLVLDVDEIRPYGMPIRGFGGVASGCAPLLDLLYFINEMLNQHVGEKLDTSDVVDMVNCIGRTVVAGNVRRSALIALGSSDDKDFSNLKNFVMTAPVVKDWATNPHTGEPYPVLKSVEELMGMGYSEEEAEELRYHAWAQGHHRHTSNNSVTVDEPEKYDYGFIATAAEATGEIPGVLKRWLMQNFGRIIDGFREAIDGGAVACNPCGEIGLESAEPCNLAELMLPVMYKKGIDPAEVLPFMVHYTKRITFSPYDWEQSREVISRNRRLGISISGFMDWVLLRFGKSAIIGWKKYRKEDWHDMVWLHDDRPYEWADKLPKYDPEKEVVEPVYNPELLEELDRMYKIAKRADIEYSALLTKALGYEVKPSIKITTVKPSGTVSLLSGISPGVHAHYFRYGIRRIRVQQDDPLLKLAQFCGYHAEPVSAYTWAIEFPVKAPTADHPDFRSADEITIEEQFAMQNVLCVYWADNMVSCTITFHPEEQEKIAPLLAQYNKRIKSTSLNRYSGHGFKFPPYEPKDKAWYEETIKNIKWQPHEAYHMLMNTGQFADREMTLAEALECAGGACPVR